MSVAYLSASNVVLRIAPDASAQYAPPAYASTQDGIGASVGDAWNGSAYVPPPEPVAVTNQRTIEQQADAALTSNLQLIADVNSFLNGAGAGSANLTLGQLSAFARQIAPAVKSLAQQNNGIIRLLRGNFSGTN